MITHWSVSPSGSILLLAEDGRVVSENPTISIVGKDWQDTKTKALKLVGEDLATAIADNFFFRTDEEAIQFLRS